MANPTNSPITGIIEENEVILDFGRFEGKTVEQVARLAPEFYQALADKKDAGVYAIKRHKDKTFRLYLNPLVQMDH